MSKTMQAGDYFNFAAFRNYMTAAQAERDGGLYGQGQSVDLSVYRYNQAATAETFTLTSTSERACRWYRAGTSRFLTPSWTGSA